MRFLKSTRVRIVAAIVVVLVVVFCVMTAVLFVYPDLNPPRRSDAIVVLGGHGEPAFDKGVALAKQGYAPQLVLSLQNWQHCAPYQSYLAVHLPKVHVNCFKANPQTTQGEARGSRRSRSASTGPASSSWSRRPRPAALASASAAVTPARCSRLRSPHRASGNG